MKDGFVILANFHPSSFFCFFCQLNFAITHLVCMSWCEVAFSVGGRGKKSMKTFVFTIKNANFALSFKRQFFTVNIFNYGKLQTIRSCQHP